jgi:plasmid replication initiation protein
LRHGSTPARGSPRLESAAGHRPAQRADRRHVGAPSYDDQQLELFRARAGDIAARDAQDLMSWPFFSLAKVRRVTPIDFRMGDVSIRVEATAEHGMATIWDADVLIWAASQIVDARSGLAHVAPDGRHAV